MIDNVCSTNAPSYRGGEWDDCMGSVCVQQNLVGVGAVKTTNPVFRYFCIVGGNFAFHLFLLVSEEEMRVTGIVP